LYRGQARRVLYCALLGVTTAVLCAAEVTLRPLGATNGLAAKVVPSLITDRNGFLWVASREGLYRYDGYRAVRYAPDSDDPRSITDVDLRSVYEDREGVIWVGTNTGGLNRFNPATGGFDRYRHDSADAESLSNDSVYFMADGPEGDLWVGSQVGLNRLDRRTGRFIRYLNDPEDETSLSNDYVFNVLLDSSNTLWVATVGGGLNRWHPYTDRFSRFDLAALTGGPSGLNDYFGLA
jgi:ligand-binding sensor domain-containing protein